MWVVAARSCCLFVCFMHFIYIEYNITPVQFIRKTTYFYLIFQKLIDIVPFLSVLLRAPCLHASCLMPHAMMSRDSVTL